MTLMLIHQHVENFEAWRPYFEAHEEHRRAAGLTNGRVFRADDDGNDLVILFDIEDEARADAYLHSDDVREEMTKAGATSPPTVRYF